MSQEDSVRAQEAATLAEWVLGLGLPRGTVCLNIGSSTKQFRQQEQPHVQRLFVEPLETAGIRFVHCDMKSAEGVDEVGDVLDPHFQSRLKGHRAGIIVCSNLLEHLTEPREFAKACSQLVRDGGYALFSVPSRYPYHPDPIDTMLRLKPGELAAMLPPWPLVRSAELQAGSYWGDLNQAGHAWRRVAKQAARVALPMYRRKQWRANASRLSWLFRPYKVSLVLIKKPDEITRTTDSKNNLAKGRRSTTLQTGHS